MKYGFKCNFIFSILTVMLLCVALAACGADPEQGSTLGVVDTLPSERFTEPSADDIAAVPATVPVESAAEEAQPSGPMQTEDKAETVPAVTEAPIPIETEVPRKDPSEIPARTDIPVRPEIRNPIYMDGGVYRIVEKDLSAVGIPCRITSDMVGESITFLDEQYTPCEDATDRKLCEYGPYPGRSLYIVDEGGRYQALVLDHFMRPDPQTAVPLFQLYEYYGLVSPENIVSFSCVSAGSSREKTAGKDTGDTEAISRFYDLSFSLPTLSEAQYYGDLYWDIQNLSSGSSKYENRKAKIEADRITLAVELTSGRSFCLDFYPAYGYMTSGETGTYYQLTDEMLTWLCTCFQ